MPAKKKTKRPVGAAKKRSAAPKSAAQPLAGALAEAAWAEADLALAEALVEFDALETADKPSARKAAMALLGQALARAGRKRGLTRLGELGARSRFSRDEHDLTEPVAKTPRSVIIKARGVARGTDVLRRPRVGLAKPAGGRRKKSR